MKLITPELGRKINSRRAPNAELLAILKALQLTLLSDDDTSGGLSKESRKRASALVHEAIANAGSKS